MFPELNKPISQLSRRLKFALSGSILVVALSACAAAQTVVPKEKIPADAPPEVKGLIEQLYVSNPVYLARTASSLGTLAALGKDATASIPFLVGILYDDRPLKIVTSYGGMQLCSPNPQIPCPISGEPTTAGRQAAAALSRFGEPALQPLLQALRTGLPSRDDRKSSYVQETAVYALGLMKDKRAADELLQAVNESSGLPVRLGALTALGELGDHRATEPLLQIVGGRDQGAKLTAAQALVNMGKPRPMPQLFVLLKDEDHLTEQAAAYALGQIGVADKDETVIAPLILKLGSQYVVREVAARYLFQMARKYKLAEVEDPALVDLLITNLKSQDRRVAAAAAYLLGSMRVRRAVPALVEAAWSDQRGWRQNTDEDVSKSAGTALYFIKDPAAVDSLIDLARKKNCGFDDGCSAIFETLFTITGVTLHSAVEWQRWWLRNRRSYLAGSR